MLLDDLQAAIGPAVALLLVGLEAVRQQAVAIALVGVMRLPALFEHGEAEIGVFADRVARPGADRCQRRAADQAHRAVHDDGVAFVALNHADVEEAGIFAVHGVVHQAALAVAMILRRLDQPDIGVGEGGDEVTQPIRVHDIVGVDDADDLGVLSGVLERDTERAGLEAFAILDVEELEAIAEQLAVLFDRPPQGGIRRVVDGDDAFEIRIFEPRHRIERLLEHLRRLAIGRDVDRDFRQRGASGTRVGLGSRQRRRDRRRTQQARRLAAERDHRDLFHARERDDDQRDQQHDAEAVERMPHRRQSNVRSRTRT